MLLQSIIIITLSTFAFSIIPFQPIQLSPNTQNSPSVYLLPFKLTRTIPANSSIVLVFTSYLNPVIPTSCKFVNTTISSSCVNLNLNIPLTTGINIISSTMTSINPNINASLAIVVQSNSQLLQYNNYYLQIFLSNPIPAINTISDSIQFYTVSSTGLLYEQNWNFGQVMYEPPQTNNNMNINLLTNLLNGIPGNYSTLSIEVAIGVAIQTTYSRIKIVLPDPFLFLSSAIISVLNDPLYSSSGNSPIYGAPVISQTQLLTSNILVITFNEQFIVGRKFVIQITNIQNPFSISTSIFSIYSLPYNSVTPYQALQQRTSFTIATNPFPLIVNLLLPNNMPFPSSPMQLYLNSPQYIQIQVTTNYLVPIGYALYISIPSAIFIYGSAYAVANTLTNTFLVYNYTANSLIISNFGVIPSGTILSITLKVKIILASVSVKVNIDQYSNIMTSTPLYTGTSSIFTAQTSYSSIMTSITSNGNQNNILNSMIATPSSISFTIYPIAASTGCSVSFYVNSYMGLAPSFSTATSCKINYPVALGGNGTTQSVTCAYSITPNYLMINISSTSSSIYFPVGIGSVVTITDLKYAAVSANMNYLYDFYFIFMQSQAVGTPTYCWIASMNVLPERNYWGTNIQFVITHNQFNLGSNYPNIIRILSILPNNWNSIILQSNQVRTISIFSFNQLSNLIYNENNYPCSSTIGAICNYTQGDRNSITDLQHPLDWDRVDIFLQGQQNSTKFHVIVPIYLTLPLYQYEIFFGKYNSQTRQFTYYQIYTPPISPNNNYVITQTSTPTRTSSSIKLGGKSGSYINNVEVDIFPSGSFVTTNQNYAGLFISSTWQIFPSNFSFVSVISNNSVAMFQISPQQFPLVVNFNNQYITYMPLVVSSSSNLAWSIFLNSLYLPYTYDLPYYNIYLVDDTGTVNSYNQFINSNQNIFYYSNLKSLQINCLDNSLGVINTYCTVYFENSNQLLANATIYIDFEGMTSATTYCFLNYFNKISLIDQLIPIKCSSTSNQSQLIINLLNPSGTINYPVTNYTLLIYGVGIISNSINQSITFTLRDSSGNYIIETGNRILLTTVPIPIAVNIQQITYQYNNPVVPSAMFIIFSLPRNMYLDETLAIVLGKDLTDTNIFIQKLNITLYNSNGNLIDITYQLNMKNYIIILTVANPSLIIAGNYTINFYGLQIPSSNMNNLFYIIYQRLFDSVYTIFNVDSTTPAFPTLNPPINSLILMNSYFNTQGQQYWIEFNIINQNYPVDNNMIWILNFPRYFSQNLWNDNSLIYCQISKIRIPCKIDVNTPFQMIIYNSPKLINALTNYTIDIFGISCPRKVNFVNTYPNEFIFIGIALNTSSSSYIEYTQISPNQSVIDPFTIGSYGLVIVQNVISTSNYAFGKTYLYIYVTCSITIPLGNYIYLTLPQQWNNLNDLPLQIILNYAANNSNITTDNNAIVINRRIEIYVSNSILQNNIFIIQIPSIATPKKPIQSNMNNIHVLISSNDKYTTVAASTVKTNMAPILTFISNPLYISFNNNNLVTITAGTYTQPLPITSSNNQPFLSNMLITFLNNNFIFLSNPLSIYLGDNTQYFYIGAAMTIIPTFYVYNILKAQTSLFPYYTYLNNNNIEVTNNLISISIPSTITVPLGGCSIPINISLTNAPFSDLSIQLSYDQDLFSNNIFQINQQVSNNQLNYTNNLTYQWLSFCSDASLKLLSVLVNLSLGGTNANSYILNNYFINIVIDTTISNIIPSFNISQIGVSMSVGTFNVTFNTNGIFFYSLHIGYNITPIDIRSLQSQLKTYALILETQQDYMKHIYLSDRDYRIGLTPISQNSTTLSFNNLIPSANYTLCGYFQNQFGVISNFVCNLFITPTWGNFSKATIQYSKSLSQNQINQVLCFFVRQVSTKITNIVNLNGQSCSLATFATNYNYYYQGVTVSSDSNQTTIYLFQNPALFTDFSNNNFLLIFNGSGQITSTSLSNALTYFSIDFIKNSSFIGNFSPFSAKNMIDGFQQYVFFDTPIYSNNQFIIPNIRLQHAGTVYFIMILVKQISTDLISRQTNITIVKDVAPTAEQILNCQNSNNYTVYACARVVLNSQQILNLTFANVTQNSTYKLYYTSANEFPLRPIVTGVIQSALISSVSYEVVVNYSLYILLIIFGWTVL